MTTKLLILATAACTGLLACASDDVAGPKFTSEALVAPADAEGATVKVMTRNIYLGFDIDQVIAGEMGPEEGIAALMATWFPDRAVGLAAEIAATQPDLIGLQEVVTWNIGSQEMDFLNILMATLAAFGLDYEVVANNTTTDITVPVGPGIRYRDHDVILARDDDRIELGTVATEIYGDYLSFTLFGVLPGTRPLGFVAVEASVDDVPFVFASTHLETQNYPDIQIGQTKQLINWTKHQKLPVVVVGDFNSAANDDAPDVSYTGTYRRLLIPGTFEDLWVMAHPDEPGLTCCYEPNLIEAEPGYDQRLDLILVDKAGARLMSDVTATIVGRDPIQASQPRWASDHAGVVASFYLQAPKH